MHVECTKADTHRVKATYKVNIIPGTDQQTDRQRREEKSESRERRFKSVCMHAKSMTE